MVGLGSVDNTADTAKPVSTAQQTALDLKAPLASPSLTGTPLAPTATGGTNTTQIATTAFVATALSSATITSLDDVADVTITSAANGDLLKWNGTAWVNAAGYALLASPTFTGTVTLPSGTVTSAMILDETIANADISTTAAIDLGKLADVSTSAQTASYTLVLADKNKIVEMSVATANNLTVPPNSSVAYPVGAQINILQTGVGQTTIVEGAGVTVNRTPGLKLRAQWSSATLIKRATDTWVLIGDLSA